MTDKERFEAYAELVAHLKSIEKKQWLDVVQVLMKDNISMYQQNKELLNGKQGSSEERIEQPSPGDDKQ